MKAKHHIVFRSNHLSPAEQKKATQVAALDAGPTLKGVTELNRAQNSGTESGQMLRLVPKRRIGG